MPREPEQCFDCPKCGKRNWGFARCQASGCDGLRQEFRRYPQAVSNELGHCAQSGSETDVRLANGDFLWAPYFLQFMAAGLVDEDLQYTDKFYDENPHLSPQAYEHD